MLNQRPVVHWIRRELLVLLAYFGLALIITYPAILHVNDSAWLVDSVNDPDVFIKLWDVWYLDKLVHGTQGFFHTDYLFHPAGLDLTYHTFNLPHMLVVYALIPFTGSAIAAYNLTSILLTVFTAYSGYLLTRYLLSIVGTRYSVSAARQNEKHNAETQSREDATETVTPPLRMERGPGGEVSPFLGTILPAFYGGCVLGFSQWVVHNFRHPDLSLLVTFALGLLLFIHACRTQKLWAGVGAGLMVGITAYIGMYIVVVMGIIMAAITLIHLPKNFLRIRFWLMLVLCGITAVIIAAPRILPMVRGNLTFVLEDKYQTYHHWESVDLVNYFVPSEHPVWGSAFTLPDGAIRYHMFYLGWIPLVLVFVGLMRRRHRGDALFWLVLLVFFMLLSMGTILNINGVAYTDFPMPKTLLNALPVVFEAFGRPDNFTIGVVLPLSIGAAFGLKTIIDAVGATRRVAQDKLSADLPEKGDAAHRPYIALFITALLVGLTLFELSVGTYPGRDVNGAVSPFYRNLANEDGDFALIQLPMGRTPSKTYLFYQTIHGKPMVEGLASRTPAGAYDFINGNALLSAWNRLQPRDCNADLSGALDALTAADFRYVVIQKNQGNATDTFKSYFVDVAPVYEDDGIVVYQTADVRVGC